MVLNHKNVKSQKEVFVVEYQDGMIDGHKYMTRTLQTDYVGFFASPAENYYMTLEIAELVAKNMNKEGN